MSARRPVTTKREMYRRLESGDFGNTIPMWTNVEAWENLAPGSRLWGVRTMTPGGPCRLNCPADEVTATFRRFERDGHRPNISMMVDRHVTAFLEVWESPTGLVVEGVEWPRADLGTWRTFMPNPQHRRNWTGIAARHVLHRHLNANSRDDLESVLATYPDHVVELSALTRCLGSIPHRNAVVWEVRAY